MATKKAPMHWIVITESGSAYHLDLHRRTLRRNGGAGASGLRRDGQEIRIVAMDEPVVGRSWRLLLDLGLESGALTTRVTTPVVAVEPAVVCERQRH